MSMKRIFSAALAVALLAAPAVIVAPTPAFAITAGCDTASSSHGPLTIAVKACWDTAGNLTSAYITRKKSAGSWEWLESWDDAMDPTYCAGMQGVSTTYPGYYYVQACAGP